MEKSIETIWKEGFLAEDALVAPKLNDLYRQKSQHVIEKFQRMFRTNLIAIAGAALLLFGGSFWLGIPYTGAFVFLLLALQAAVGAIELKELNKIDKGESSYQYLKSFSRWIKDTMTLYGRINRFFYPAFLLAFAWGMWSAHPSEGLRNKLLNDPDILLIYGIPLWYIVPTVIFALLFSIFSQRIYQFDIDTIYGRVMNKLEEMITDMEELRK